MNSEKFDSETIERYLRQEMTGQELRDFENELQNNEALRKEVQFHRDLIAGLKASVKSDAKDKLDEIRAEKTQRPSLIRQCQPYIAIAALIVLLMGLVAVIYQGMQSSPYSDELFAQHFETYPNNLTEQTRGEASLNSTLDSAMYYYSEQNYAFAVKYFKKADKEASKAGITDFYLGNAYLSMGKPQKAVEVLEAAQGNLNSEYQMQGKWYLGLAYLKSGNLAQAKTVFSEITQSDADYYRKKAMEILKELPNESGWSWMFK